MNALSELARMYREGELDQSSLMQRPGEEQHSINTARTLKFEEQPASPTAMQPSEEYFPQLLQRPFGGTSSSGEEQDRSLEQHRHMITEDTILKNTH